MKMLIALIIAAAIVCISIYIYKESNGYTIVNYELSSSKIKKDIKIVYLSDLHNTEYGECNNELIRSIDEISPDIVIFGGDMVTSCMDTSYDFSNTLDFIKNLSEKYKIYYGIGNHEAKFREYSEKFKGKYETLINFLNEIDVPLLADCKCMLDEYGIDIYCVDFEHEYYRRIVTKHIPDDYLSGKLGEPDDKRYSILIAHNPEHFKKCAKWGADLVLSGHVHGGVVDIPYIGGVVSPAFKLFPKYDSGKFTEDSSTMILSRGIGSHTIPIRINNKAEIVVITIKGE